MKTKHKWHSNGNCLVMSELVQGILKGEVSLYHWPPVWLVWNQLYSNWKFLFLFAKQTNPNQSNRRSTVHWYFPLQYSLVGYIGCLSDPLLELCSDIFWAGFAGQGVLNKVPTVWLDGRHPNKSNYQFDKLTIWQTRFLQNLLGYRLFSSRNPHLRERSVQLTSLY